jgi:hypothetical protein
VKGVSIVYIVLFSISGILHIWQNQCVSIFSKCSQTVANLVLDSKYKAWPIAWFNPAGCIIFVAGFICREYQAWHPTADLLSAIQGLFYAAV